MSIAEHVPLLPQGVQQPATHPNPPNKKKHLKPEAHMKIGWQDPRPHDFHLSFMSWGNPQLPRFPPKENPLVSLKATQDTPHIRLSSIGTFIHHLMLPTNVDTKQKSHSQPTTSGMVLKNLVNNGIFTAKPQLTSIGEFSGFLVAINSMARLLRKEISP